MKKYEFTGKTKVIDNVVVRQIRRMEDGLVGGWIEGEHNLSQEGKCFVYDNGIVRGNAKVLRDAQVRDNSKVLMNAIVTDKAIVHLNTRVYDNALVKDEVILTGRARARGNCVIGGSAKVGRTVTVEGNAIVGEHAMLLGNIVIRGNARVGGHCMIDGEALIEGVCHIRDNSKIGNNVIIKDGLIEGNTIIKGNVKVLGKIQTFGDVLLEGNGEYIDPVIVNTTPVKMEYFSTTFKEGYNLRVTSIKNTKGEWIYNLYEGYKDTKHLTLDKERILALVKELGVDCDYIIRRLPGLE